MIIVPRSFIGTPQPPANRPKLDRVDVLIAHHVGVSTSITSRYQDPAKELSDAKAAAAWGISSGRSWEYSYMIGLGGSIFEQAGEYMAQHCLNFNTKSGGVLFLNADEIQVNSAQVASWHWLRADMVRRGTLASDHEVAPHYRYRSTGCPGIRAQPPGGPWESPTGEGRMGNLIPALATTVAPEPPEEDDMPLIAYYALPPADMAGNPPHLVCIDGAALPEVRLPKEQYEKLLKGAGLA
jgi:hypothetical protein